MGKEANVRLREEREKRGWSQARVAEQIGTDPINVSRWERGYATPSPYFREKLCELYGRDARDLGFLGQELKVDHQPDAQLSEAVPDISAGEQQSSIPAVPDRSSRILACLAYLLFWVSGVCVFLFAGDNSFLRFHSLQSVTFFGGSNLLTVAILAAMGVVLKIANTGNKMILTIIFGLLVLILALINFLTLIAWVVGMVLAWRGRYYSFPFVGRLRKLRAGDL